MAITYKGGNRLIFHSDYEDNFSYADQTAANTAWEVASNVAGRRVNVTKQNLELENDSGTTNYAVVHDLGASVVDTSSWVLRFSADVTLSSGSNNWCYIGLFGSDESVGGGTNQNFITVAFQNDGVNTKFWGVAGVGKNVNAGNSDYFAASGNATLTSTKYYIQLRRLTATQMDIKIFKDQDYSVLHLSMTMSGSSISLGDLRYIKFANNTTSGSGSIDIVMDDVKFYNGVRSTSSAKPTADGTNENGSTFIESDTGKEHILNYGAWTEKNQPADCLAELLSDHSGSDQKMRFWDFFGGKDVVYTNGWQKKVVGGSVALSNEIDGGVKLTSGSANANYAMMAFKDFTGGSMWRQYDGANSTFITVLKHTPSSDGYAQVGLHGNPASAGEYYTVYVDGGSTYVTLLSAGSGGSAHTDTSTAGNTQAWHVYKGVSASSTIKLYVDGVLSATQSTANRVPTAKLCPYLTAAADSSGVNHYAHVRYYEAYNT